MNKVYHNAKKRKFDQSLKLGGSRTQNRPWVIKICVKSNVWRTLAKAGGWSRRPSKEITTTRSDDDEICYHNSCWLRWRRPTRFNLSKCALLAQTSASISIAFRPISLKFVDAIENSQWLTTLFYIFMPLRPVEWRCLMFCCLARKLLNVGCLL